MNERLLQYIWQFQYYSASELETIDGLTIQIIYQGQHNVHQGPDFNDARIRIDGTIWIGNVELHLKTSDWQRHKHQLDKQYDNVVLHVVWQHDIIINQVPVLALQERIPQVLLARYEELMYSPQFIPCGRRISLLPQIEWIGWEDRLLVERLERKAAHIYEQLSDNLNHWEESYWWLLARNFGLHVNSETFEAIARSIPLKIIGKHSHQPVIIEALLMGQAGLLKSSFTDEYPKHLWNEYRHVKQMYLLKPIHQPILFLRMRPGNFPTIRLSQLGKIIVNRSHSFDTIRHLSSSKDLKSLFDVKAADYWSTHYRFDKLSGDREKRLGETMIDNIIINTVCPLLYAYGKRTGSNSLCEKAIAWLSELDAEHTRITKGFSALGIFIQSAAQSQALLELKSNYCDQKRCLDCTVGYWLLSKDERAAL